MMSDHPPPLPPRPARMVPASTVTPPVVAPRVQYVATVPTPLKRTISLQPTVPANTRPMSLASVPDLTPTSREYSETQQEIYPWGNELILQECNPPSLPSALRPQVMSLENRNSVTPEGIRNPDRTSLVSPTDSQTSMEQRRPPIPAPRVSLQFMEAQACAVKKDEVYSTIYDENIYEPMPGDQDLQNLPSVPIEVGTWINDSDSASVTSEPCSWLEEPLYQFTRCYEAVPEKESYTSLEVEDDFYSEVLQSTTVRRPTAHKTPWIGVSRVIDANVLGKMSKSEIAVQEAKFEILTSESSFLKSLTILKKHFMTSRELTNETILLREDHNHLFSLVKPIIKTSKMFLADMDKCWKKSIYLPGIYDVISHHAKENFNSFVVYCMQLDDVREKLKTLNKNKKFSKALTELESSERCGNLPIYSFLSIPMKRIINLNLLLKTARAVMLQNYECDKSSDFETELGSCLTALDHVQELCKRSDQRSQTTTRMKKLFDFHAKLRFPVHVMQVSIISPERWIVMHGDVRVHRRSEMENTASSIAGKKTKTMIKRSNTTIRLFLLSDMLILTKIGVDGYKVQDYCSREKIQVASPNIFMGCNPELVLDGKHEYKILLILQANHDNRRIELVLSCSEKRDRDIWVKNLKQSQATDASVKPATQRMVCIYPFHTFERNQIPLLKGDEVIVHRTLDNGWLEGVRVRGNRTGSFPPSRLEEATSVFPLVEIFN